MNILLIWQDCCWTEKSRCPGNLTGASHMKACVLRTVCVVFMLRLGSTDKILWYFWPNTSIPTLWWHFDYWLICVGKRFNSVTILADFFSVVLRFKFTQITKTNFSEIVVDNSWLFSFVAVSDVTKTKPFKKIRFKDAKINYKTNKIGIFCSELVS